MDALALLAQQLDTVNLRFNHSAGDLLPAELTARPLPEASPIGFTIWHMARSQDWAVNTAVRDVPEVVTRDPWRGSSLATPGIGTGFTMEEAAAVAARIALPEALAYADAVHRETLGWLKTLDEPFLDFIPDARAHDARHPAYQTPGFRAEMDGGPEHDDAVGRKGGLPVWVFLASVAVTHLHRHLGEVDLLKSVLRSRPATGIASITPGAGEAAAPAAARAGRRSRP